MIKKKIALLATGSLILGSLSGFAFNLDILMLLLISACAGLIIANWGTLRNKLLEIADVFQETFRSLFSSLMTKSSEQSKSACLLYGEMAAVHSVVHNARFSNSASNHINKAFIEKIIKNTNALFVYVSNNRETALLVYKTAVSTSANVNIDFAYRGSESTGIYQYMNFPIPSGVYVFLLYDLRSHYIFHTQMRFNQDDTEQIRYAYRLSWTVYPYFLYEPKYELGGTVFQSGLIFN